MIVLEYRLEENFRSATDTLQACGLPFQLEAAQEAWRPSLVWLFEEQVLTEAHRKAVTRARTLEQLDRFQQKQFAVLNLAMPQ